MPFCSVVDNGEENFLRILFLMVEEARESISEFFFRGPEKNVSFFFGSSFFFRDPILTYRRYSPGRTFILNLTFFPDPEKKNLIFIKLSE